MMTDNHVPPEFREGGSEFKLPWNYSKPPMDGSPFLAVFSTKTGWDYYPCFFDQETEILSWYEDGGPIGYSVDEMRGWIAITPPTVV